MIGVYIPGGSAQQFIDSIKLAEAKGVPSFWLTSGGLLPDVITVFAAAAMQTSKIKMGTSITQTWPRHPVAIASQCIAMSQLAPGRFRIGLGPSHQPAVEGMYGVPYTKPLTNLREYLYTVQSILKQGEVEFSGTFVKTTAKLGQGPGNNLATAPIDVPVMASALRPASFSLCGELADGAISWVSPWEYLRDTAMPAMQEGAEKAGRATPPMVVHVPVVLTDDIEAAHEAATPILARYAGLANYRGMFEKAGFHDAAGGDKDALIDAVAVYGTDETIAARLGQILSEGAGEIIAHQVPVGTGDVAAQTEHFLEVVARANKLAGIGGMKQLKATVDAVCLSVSGTRVAKEPRDEAFIGPHGFVGDRHEAEFRKTPGADTVRPNHRQWSAVSTEEVAELCGDMGVDPPFAIGALGENLRLSGIRLADVPDQTVLEFPSGARLLVSQPNQPCVNAAKELMATYGGSVGQDFVKQAFGRRGILGTVLETGVIRSGDEVRVVVPEVPLP